MFGRAEEMTDKNLTENDIQLHANQSSNEEAFTIFTQLKKGKGKKEINYEFSKKIKTILPNSSLRTNVKHCEKFLQNYRNNYTIVLRDIKVRKKKNIDKSYIRHTNGNYECIDCNEEFNKVRNPSRHRAKRKPGLGKMEIDIGLPGPVRSVGKEWNTPLSEQGAEHGGVQISSPHS